MRKYLLIALLSVPLLSQSPKAFSQPWDFSTTKPWKVEQAMKAGAVCAVFSNIYCDQTGTKWYWRILIPALMGLTYEVMRWAEGKQPLGLNAVYAGVGAAGTTFVWRVRF